MTALNDRHRLPTHNMSNDTQTALTADDVAELLNMSSRSVRRAAGRGEIPGAFRVGTKWRFKTADVRKLIDGQSTATTGTTA